MQSVKCLQISELMVLGFFRQNNYFHGIEVVNKSLESQMDICIKNCWILHLSFGCALLDLLATM
jgi:hypothetical protein